MIRGPRIRDRCRCRSLRERCTLVAHLRRYLRADGAALPFRSEVFDVLICVAAIAYLGDAVTALRECRRVCRPGARLVLSIPANGGITSFALLHQAAAVHGVALREPNAGLGDEDTRRSVLGSAGLLCDGVVEHTFASRPPGTPG